MPPERAYRIGHWRGCYSVYSAVGATRKEGRWHTVGQEVIYASVHYSTALLEARAYVGTVRPSNQRFVEIGIPVSTSYEILDADDLPSWDEPGSHAARAFGSLWLVERRSALLIVPSVIAPLDHNLLINPNHPDSRALVVGDEQPVRWDSRLF